ncbi:MAG: hypothetical protein ABIO81_03005 [Ginsengibacter sp.]
MENFYTAYLRTVNGDTFYFVKKYQLFPEYKDVPPVLENYAMHTDFVKACKIAMIHDKVIQQQLIDELQYNNGVTNVKEIQPARAKVYKLIKRQINIPARLKLGWLTKVS